MRRLACVLLVLQAFEGQRPDPCPLSFFEPDAVVSPAEQRALAHGAPVIKFLDTGGREFGVFTAVALEPQVTVDRATAWLRRMESLRKNEYVLASGRFSTPPVPADLQGLTLAANDLDDIRQCRPGRCDLKLSAAEIDELTRVIAAAGREWRPAVQAAFRQIIVRRVTTYTAGGLRALEPYSDRKRPRPTTLAFNSLLEHSAFLREQLPGVVERLSTWPADSSNGEESFMYWSQEELGGRTVVTATHLALVAGDGVSTPAALSIGIQIFATHYLDASLGVTAIVRDPASGRLMFVHVNRSEVDLLGGFWGPFARSAIEGRIRKDGPGILRIARTRLGSGHPSNFTRGPRSF